MYSLAMFVASSALATDMSQRFRLVGHVTVILLDLMFWTVVARSRSAWKGISSRVELYFSTIHQASKARTLWHFPT